MTTDQTQARITSLDFLRGIAVLGMLVANVPWHAGDSMSQLHDADAWSVAAWLSQYLIFDQRFMPIFCMLFGASIFLLVGNSQPRSGFSLYYLRRMGVLFLFGLAHAYLLWPGDILITYAVCGPFLLLFLRAPVWVLFAVGLSFKGVDILFGQWPEAYYATLDRWLFGWVEYGPAPSTISEAYAGGYSDLFAYNAWRNQFIQWTALPYFRVWNAFGFMLIGMALYRLGVLQGNRSRAFYKRLFLSCFCTGLPLVLYGVLARIGVNSTVGPFLGFEATLPLQDTPFRIGCALVSIAFMAGIHWWHPKLAGGFKTQIEAVGKMALSNYVFHSIFFLIIFHGLMPQAFGALDHDILFLFVLLVWGIQLVGSKLWLNTFKQGPLEGLLRRLAGSRS